MDEPIRILMLAGSLRRDSHNRALLRAAEQLAPCGVSTVTVDGLGTLPFYDGDVEDKGFPAAVVALRRAIVEADALIIATPEYNGATSGATGGIESIVRILGRLRSDLPDHAVAVPFAARAFDDDQSLVDSEVRAEVAELADRARSNIARAARPDRPGL